MRYGAFISYSRVDAELAVALQRGVERFGKRWNQTRAVKLFRDDASLSANAGLWSSIEVALAESSWLVLIASPNAAASTWVGREVSWWLEHRSVDSLLIVITDGGLEWDESAGDFDWARTTALPAVLSGTSKEVPRYVDARWSRTPDALSEVNPALNDAIVDIASTVRGVEKDELVGTAVREQQRTTRLARAVRIGLATLFAAALVAAVLAVDQKNNAEQQATTSLSRQLAAAAGDELTKDLDVAMLLAVEGYEVRANDQTRGALMRANTASPKLVRYVPMGATVTKVAGSRDGKTAVAGLADGRVMSWRVADSRPREVLKLRGAISSVSVSRDGEVVAAADGQRSAVRRRGHPAVGLAAPAGKGADAVALTPAGRVLLVHGTDLADSGEGSLSIVDVANGVTRAVHRRVGFDVFVVTPSDGEALVLADGFWERRRISGWRLRAQGSMPLGVHRSAGEPSADGRFVTATNGATPIPVWPARAGDATDPAPYDAQAPIRSEGLVVLSPDGAQLAAVEGGAIFVSPVVAASRRAVGATELRGSGGTRDVRFFGDASRLLVASRSSVAVWHLGQIDRLARTSRTALPPRCNACPPPLLALSPDGRQLAMLADFLEGSGSPLIQALGAKGARAIEVDTGSGHGPPVWVDGGRTVVFPVTDDSDVRPGRLRPGLRVWLAGSKGVAMQATAAGADDRTVLVVDTHGTVYVQDAATGKVRDAVPGPPALRPDGAGLRSAAIQSSAELVAMLSEGALTVTDVRQRAIVARLPAKDAVHVAYAGERLLVERDDGGLEVWDERGNAIERVLPGDGGYVEPPVGSAQGTRVARQRQDGAIELSDLDSGALVGRFEAPPTGGPPASGVTFSRDGRTLISVHEIYPYAGALVIRRDISDDGLVRSACAAAGRDLSEDEWRTFVGTDPADRRGCR